MKHIITFFLSLLPLLASAQEPQTIGGYILEGDDSFEELDPAVLNARKTKVKNLASRGTRVPGVVISFEAENLGQELGTIVEVKEPFLVQSISFTVTKNMMDGSRAEIRIYRINEASDSLENIVTMPISQEIPLTSSKKNFSIAPEEIILLEPDTYFVSICLTEVGNGHVLFPLFLKESYIRKDPAKPMEKWNANIGMTVRGLIRKG